MAARHAARDYDLVALSDHGQNLGPTFSQVCGRSIEDVLAELMGGSAVVVGHAGPSEHAGSGRRIAMEFGRASGLVPFLARRSFRPKGPAGERMAGKAAPGPTPSCARRAISPTSTSPVPPGRMSRGGIEKRYPGLIGALAHQPGIGVVLVVGDDGATVAIGSAGEAPVSRADAGGDAADASDPLAPFGPMAREALASLATLTHLGDVILIASVDPDTDEAVGFEELVGSHGGLGGAQMQPFLLCPASWQPEADPLLGAVAVHDQLCEWRAGNSGARS